MAAGRRILQLYYEPHVSGVTRHVVYLLRALDRDRHDIRVLCSTGDRRIVEALSRVIDKDRVTVVPPARFFSARGVVAARNIIRGHRIETVHVHNLQSFAWGYLGAMSAGCRRVVFTPHVSTVGIKSVDSLMRCAFRMLKPFTHACIAVSHSQRDALLRWGIADPSRVVAIPNCIDPNEIHSQLDGVVREKTRQNSGIDEDKVVVCQIGRLDRQKNPLLAVRAAHLTRHTAPELIFLLIGDGPLRKEVEANVLQFGLTDRVKVMGYRGDAIRLLQASDILMLTSRWEGLSYVLAEASLLKKPIVATPTEGTRDLVKHGFNGYLAETEEDFAHCLVELSASRDLRVMMGQRSYERNAALFDLQGMAKDPEAVYAS